MRRRVFPIAVLVLLALGAPAARSEDAPKEPAPAPPQVTVPVGIPVQLDGRMPSAEWSDARVLPVGRDGSRLLLKQWRGTLMVGLRVPPWLSGSTLWLMFTPDAEGAGLYAPGAIRVDFEPLQHSRRHLVVYRREEAGEAIVPHAGVGRAWLGPVGANVEIAIPLSRLGIEEDAAGPIRFAMLLARPKVRTHPTWPAGLSTRGLPGKPPPDLASSRRWGRLGGWQQADGPGAFAAADWTRVLEEDDELARRGRDAHAFGMLIDEEPQVRKRDREQVETVFANLAWIAEREPLTPDDLLLMAKTYRFLNRHDAALATLDALEAFADWRGNDLLAYQRALTYRAAGRYADAAALWEALAARAQGARKSRYERTAALDRERLAGWQAEVARRREAERSAHLPRVELVTSRGTIVVLLHADDVAASVKHFLALVSREEDGKPFYAGTLFHRVIGGFLVQGGDPLTKTGGCDAGGPGDGPLRIDAETNPRFGFWRGAVGFARGPEPVNGCQFFILTAARPELGERDFTCFGHVVAGMDVVDRLEMCDALLDVRVLRPDGPRPARREGKPAGAEDEE